MTTAISISEEQQCHIDNSYCDFQLYSLTEKKRKIKSIKQKRNEQQLNEIKVKSMQRLIWEREETHKK